MSDRNKKLTDLLIEASNYNIDQLTESNHAFNVKIELAYKTVKDAENLVQQLLSSQGEDSFDTTTGNKSDILYKCRGFLETVASKLKDLYVAPARNF